MVRKTNSEKELENWCEDNGGDFELNGKTAMCHHPNGDTFKYQDSAYSSRNTAKVSGDVDFDDVKFRSNEFNHGMQDRTDDSIYFLAIQTGINEFETANVKLTDNGFEVENGEPYII